MTKSFQWVEYLFPTNFRGGGEKVSPFDDTPRQRMDRIPLAWKKWVPDKSHELKSTHMGVPLPAEAL